jgi:thiamine biosynthesis lipoprotein
MAITLDSIAKGYIVDRAMDVLKQHGIEHALINAGGDIALHGGKGVNKPWRIAIQDPQQKERHLDVVEIVSGAVATSGNYEVYFDREKVYHHIVSPATGIPAGEITSVSIKAANVMAADAMATAVFVKGPKSGRQFIERTPGIEGLVIKNNKEKIFSDKWKA